MSAPRRLLLGLIVLWVASGCASAGKRYEQGLDLERQGRDDQAIARYVQALQKDPSLQEARSRLTEAGARSIATHLADAQHWGSQDESVAAALEYRAIDGVVASARTVGVRLDLPTDYSDLRRSAFDAAIESLLAEGEAAANRGRWQEGLGAYRSARLEFHPTAEQRDRALAGESALLLSWSHAELDAGRLRSAYGVAAAVHDLEWSPWPDHETAADLMYRALMLGEVEVMVLPVVVAGRARDSELRDLEVRMNDALDRSILRSPPPFIRVTDPIAVRDVVRQAGLLDGGVRAPVLGLLLRLVDADYGAWLELVEVDATEFEVKRTTRPVQTHDGTSTSFVLEEGQRRVRAQARVIVVDRQGNEIVNQLVSGHSTHPFRRGHYDGDSRELNLDRRDVEAFDPVALGAREQAVRQAVATDLSVQLGAAVVEPVLARVP